MIVNTRYGKRFAYNLAALADVVEALDNLAVQQVLGQDLNLGKICVQAWTKYLMWIRIWTV